MYAQTIGESQTAETKRNKSSSGGVAVQQKERRNVGGWRLRHSGDIRRS